MSAEFHTDQINSWDKFTATLRDLSDEWMFRGQSENWPLQTSLERNLKSWDIDLSRAPSIEDQLVRDFRRQYRDRGKDHSLAKSDTLYCLALMQHHGAPTRLLDFSYSPYVAAKFAIGQGLKHGVVWCIKRKWCAEKAHAIVGDTLRERENDKPRDNSSFEAIYLRSPKKFVYPENPFHLSERLIIQQGIFLCPGDISVSFEQNLTALDGCYEKKNIVKLCLNLTKETARTFASQLRRMNIDAAALFPGLDGFSRSLAERVFHYEDLTN